MKRHKKLWIACAALAVVVALCAFALLYRPVPYQFLEGATLLKTHSSSMSVHIETIGATVKPGTPQPRTFKSTHYQYWVKGTVESVTNAANKELPGKDKLMWSTDRDVTYGGSRISGGAITVMPDTESSVGPEPHVIVAVVRPTTLLDLFREWLENR